MRPGQGGGTGPYGTPGGVQPEPWEPLTTPVNPTDSLSPSNEQPGETIVEPVRSGPAKVPAMADYWEVLPEYREDAEDALTKERYPRKYETEVRRYYDSLDEGAPERRTDAAGGSAGQ